MVQMKVYIKQSALFIMTAVTWLTPLNGLYAQEYDIMDRYKYALVFYDEGRIDTAYQILVSCIEDGKGMKSVPDVSKGRIYKLAAEAASVLDLMDEAELLTLRFREVQPYYIVQKDDMPEFKARMEQIRTYPKNIISFINNWPNTGPEMVRNLSPYTPEGAFMERNDDFLFGLQYKRFVHPNFTMGVGMQYGTAVKLKMAGSIHPVKGGWYYYLGVSALECPVVLNYNLYVFQNAIMYFELGFSYRKIFHSRKYGPPFNIEHSDQFGRYISVNNYAPPDRDNATSVAYFFETPLEYNFITGVGGSFGFEAFRLEYGIRYFPRLVGNDPFRDIETFDQIPGNDRLSYYDDIFLIRIKNHFQMVVTLGINLNYGAAYSRKVSFFH